MKNTMHAVTAILFLSTSAFAQDHAPKCNTGAGARYGVISYHCVSCRIDQKAEAATYHFDTEPVIVQVTQQASLQPGDVVVAVNGHPITTDEGAREFVRPSTPQSTITVRRGRANVYVKAQGDGCVSYSEDAKALPGLSRDLASVPTLPSTPENEGVRELGVGLSCSHDCSLVADGPGAYRFRGYPVIAELRSASATTAGFQVGDHLLSVDRLSLQTERGVARLRGICDGKSHVVTVKRDGKDVELRVIPE